MKMTQINKRTANRKKQVFAFIDKNGRLPSRRSKQATERHLAYKMECYLSKESLMFDSAFRNKILETGLRKTNNKRKHDEKARKQEVLDFMLTNLRAPSMLVPEEKTLCFTYRRYVLGHNSFGVDGMPRNYHSPTLEAMVKKIDKCHKTKIPYKYRASINQALVLLDEKLKVEKLGEK